MKKDNRRKPFTLKCQLCGNEMDSVSMVAMIKVVDRHRKKNHPKVEGTISYTAVRLNQFTE